MEDHPLDRDAGLQRLQQVPGDGLALAVTVGGQIELVDILEQPLELGYRALLLRADDVERFEVVLDVDAQARPRLGFVLGGHVGGIARQVTDVTAGRLHDVVGAQVTSDFARLGGRLDDDEPPNVAVARPSPPLRRVPSSANCPYAPLLYVRQVPQTRGQLTISHYGPVNANRPSLRNLSDPRPR